LSRLFDSDYYLKINPDVARTHADPLAHYLTFGRQEDRKPNPLFDPEYYRKNNHEVFKCEDDPFWHYLTIGVAEDRKPCPWFEPEFYRTVYSDALHSKLSPLAHYLKKGIKKRCYPVKKAGSLPKNPLISVVVPVYDVEEQLLNKCICSVRYQIYPHWELCLADDCSVKPHIRPTLKNWSKIDKRIKTIFLDSNQGIAGATNAAVSLASGDYIAFLDNDDELTLECLYELARKICYTDADLIYTDEDLIDAGGKQLSIFYKPSFNRELLWCHNYVTHLVAVTRKLFEKVGGVSSEYNGAQDYDLVLRLSEIATRIVHIPKVLYHWRAAETSTSINHSQKEYANEAGRRAVMTAMKRNSIEGEVEFRDWKFFYRCKRILLSKPLISVIINLKDNRVSPINYLQGLLSQTSYADLEWLVILPDKKTFEDEICKLDRRISLIEAGGKKGYASSLNHAVTLSNGEHIVFLGGWVQPLSSSWIESLLAYSQEKEIGVVGGRLRPVNNQDEQKLTIPDITNLSPLYYSNFLQGCSTHMNSLECQQYVMIALPELCMIERKLFNSLLGLDEINFNNLFYFHDLCLRLYKEGFKNIYTPECLAEIGEQSCLGFLEVDDQELKREQHVFQTHWNDLLSCGDPYWNIGLVRKNEIPSKQFFSWYAGSTAAQGQNRD